MTGEHVATIRSTDVWVVAPRANEIRELSVVADLTSLTMDDEDVESFVKSEDFLDVGRYPTARFRSVDVEALGGNEHRVRGVLALHGVSREIEFVAHVTRVGKVVTVDANFRLPRHAFRIERRDGWDFLIASDFRVRVRISATMPADNQSRLPSTST